MPTPTDVLFSDFRTNLTVHPITGDLSALTNLDAIKTSVKNLVLTQFYERPFKPNVGSNVTHYLFENFDSVTEENIIEAIKETIENNEPRVVLIDVEVNAEPDNNRFGASIIFRAINNTKPSTLDIFLERVR